ncbi:hypothetical protein CF326_g5449 [Tilletia indica]|nr:hypothetical protein CF326_g5449 [Tilletia indica]
MSGLKTELQCAEIEDLLRSTNAPHKPSTLNSNADGTGVSAPPLPADQERERKVLGENVVEVGKGGVGGADDAVLEVSDEEELEAEKDDDAGAVGSVEVKDIKLSDGRLSVTVLAADFKVPFPTTEWTDDAEGRGDDEGFLFPGGSVTNQTDGGTKCMRVFTVDFLSFLKRIQCYPH